MKVSRLIARAGGTMAASILALAVSGCGAHHPSSGGPGDSPDGGPGDPDGGPPGSSDSSTPGTPDGGQPPSDGAAGEGGGGGGPAAVWDKIVGAGGNDDVGSVVVDPSGNVIYVGTFQDAVDFGSGTPLTAMGDDIYIAKYDATGKYLWAERFGDAQTQQASGAAVDAQGDIVITGTNYGVLDFGGGLTLTTAGLQDIFVAKLDPTGKPLWAKGYGDPGNQSGQAVAVDAQGNIAITGAVEGTTDFGADGPLTSAGGADLYLAKLDPNGVTAWAKIYGDASPQYGWYVSFASGGDIVLTGDIQGAVDVGMGALTSAGGFDVLLARFHADGSAVFGKLWGDADNQLGDCVLVDAAGEIVLSGGFDGSSTVDFGKGALTATDLGAKFLVKLDGMGNAMWSTSFGDGDPFDWTSFAVDSSGGVVLAGEFKTAIDIGLGMPVQAKDGYDIFVARFDTTGKPMWIDRYGAASDQYARSVALASDGVVVGGFFQGKLGFGNGAGQAAPDMGSLLYLAELPP